MSSDIVLVKLEIELPKDSMISKISKRYSNYLIKLISILNFSHLIQIEGSNAEKLDFKSNRAEVKIFHKEKDYVLLNIKTDCSKALNTISSSALHIRYPLLIREGKLLLETITRRAEIDYVLNRFSNYYIKTKIQRIGRYNPNINLTSKQHELLNIALKQGFFEIPRKINIKTLSNQLKVSKSALSEMLRRAIKNLLLNYFRFSD